MFILFYGIYFIRIFTITISGKTAIFLKWVGKIGKQLRFTVYNFPIEMANYKEYMEKRKWKYKPLFSFSPRKQFTSFRIVILKCSCLSGKLGNNRKFVTFIFTRSTKFSPVFSTLEANAHHAWLLRFSALKSKAPAMPLH